LRDTGIDPQGTLLFERQQIKNIFSFLTTFGISLRSDRQLRTTYGRTSTREWKVLRDTDGERFVLENKVCTFSGEFVTCEKRKSPRTDLFED
jgi:hypothetical protein